MIKDTIDKHALKEKAIQLLRDNGQGDFVKPSTSQYPHIWNWDTAFIAIGLSYFDMERAKHEVRALLAGQWGTGLLPHILYPNGASDYFPTPEFWHSDKHPQGPVFPTSGFTQPPVLATAVKLMVDLDEDKTAALAFLKEVYPKILAWHRWLVVARDPETTGLVSIIHPWEAGTDNSPRFDEVMERLEPTNVPEFTRGDKKHVNPDERPKQEDYIRFMYLIGFYRDLKWDDTQIAEKAPFFVQDILLNAVLYQANEDLVALGKLLEEDTSEIEAWQTSAKKGFDDNWDEEQGLYFDRDMRTGDLLKIQSLKAMTPLYAGVASQEQAEQIVEQLKDAAAFATGDDSQYLVPTIAKNSPKFEARRYWRGPIWINTNWLIWKGLKRYGYTELAEEVRLHSLELVDKSDFVEYYDARDGSACGATGFSWSAALVIDMLAEDS